jgi:hypothetical protein
MAMLRSVRALALATCAMALPTFAAAQKTADPDATRSPSQVGSVLSTDGPQGAVIVVRGAQAYSLVSGDLLFEGDRVVTRSNGSAKISANGCEKAISATSSIVVNAELCNVVPIQLANAEPLGSADVLPAASATGATGLILPGLLAAGGTTAAAVTGSAITTSISP